MTNATDLAKMVPGFEFLQSLMKGAGTGMPNMGQWIAPTLDPKELDKRIDELRTVRFWLEQNANMLAATIQALEVQRMTLSTLQTMNLPLSDLREALTMPTARAGGKAPDPSRASAPAPESRARAGRGADAGAAPASRPSMIDPMQWWGALTQQFTQLATNAIKDSTADAARHFAGTVVRQSIDGAGETLRKAADVATDVATAPAKAAARAAGVATDVASSVASGVASGLVAGGAAPRTGDAARKPSAAPGSARRRAR
jgi:hypothetical protein